MKQSNLGIGNNNTNPYKKINNIPWATPQTKKKSLFVGGGPIKITKKEHKKRWYNPKGVSFNSGLKKSTKSWINPKRYLASTQTKKKREARAQRRDESHVERKLYDYTRLQGKISEYNKLKEDLKAGNLTTKQINNHPDIKRLTADIRKIGTIPKDIDIDASYIKSLSKKVNSSITKYEEKQKYYEDSTDKLKVDSINFIKNRTEYIKNGKPELTKKLSSLATNDHTKMAFIKIPGIGPVPVNKLKYSEFNTDNPRVTNAYLDQFKTVNDSITKINKDFNINNLSPDRKVELAKELHKITKEGIHDPVAQEHHFLKAVTDIAYKNKYYSALSEGGKRDNVLKSYMEKQVPNTHTEDAPEPNLRQKKTALEQKLRRTDSLSDTEKNNIHTEIAYLDKQLKMTPASIDRQIRAQENLMNGMSKLDPKYAEMSLALDRLKKHRQNIETVQQADFAEDTKLISSELAKLKEARTIFLATTKIDTDVDIRELELGLAEVISKFDNPEISDKQRKSLEKKKRRLLSAIKKEEVIIQNQEAFNQMQNTISTLENMTPEKREHAKEALEGKNEHELKELLTSMKKKQEEFDDNPALKTIIQKDIDQINSAIKVENFKSQINSDPNLVGPQKEHMKRQVTPDMGVNEVLSLRDDTLANKDLNFRLAKQAANEKAARASAQRTASKQAFITAKQERNYSLNTIWKRAKAAVTRNPKSIRTLREHAKYKKKYSKSVSRESERISNAVAQGKITPEKAQMLLNVLEKLPVGYVTKNTISLLRRVVNPNISTYYRYANPFAQKLSPTKRLLNVGNIFANKKNALTGVGPSEYYNNFSQGPQYAVNPLFMKRDGPNYYYNSSHLDPKNFASDPGYSLLRGTKAPDAGYVNMYQPQNYNKRRVPNDSGYLTVSPTTDENTGYMDVSATRKNPENPGYMYVGPGKLRKDENTGYMDVAATRKKPENTYMTVGGISDTGATGAIRDKLKKTQKI